MPQISGYALYKDDRGRARKYFFHDTCPVFKSYSAERKSDFCTKHKLCRVCSNKLNAPGHKKPCAHLQRFQCKTCLSQGDAEKAATHHTELHRGGKKQTPVNSQQPAHVNSQLPAPIAPCPASKCCASISGPSHETCLELPFIAMAECATSANVSKLFQSPSSDAADWEPTSTANVATVIICSTNWIL